MLTLWFVWILKPHDGDTVLCEKHHPSDETLDQGPDYLWTLNIPGFSSNKCRGVTSASWLNSPIRLCPSPWPSNHPHILIGFFTPSLHQLAGVWWVFNIDWYNMAAVASTGWMLHIGG